MGPALGDDYVSGGTVNDLLANEDGDDTLIGGGGNDFIYAEIGNNRFHWPFCNLWR